MSRIVFALLIVAMVGGVAAAAEDAGVLKVTIPGEQLRGDVGPARMKLRVGDRVVIHRRGTEEMKLAAVKADAPELARIQVGDEVAVMVYELVALGAETTFTRAVDERGMIRLPVVGEVKVAGMTTVQVEQFVAHLLDFKINVMRNPIVRATLVKTSQPVFSVSMDDAAGGRTYQLPAPPENVDVRSVVSRLLHDLEGVESVTVIRGEAPPPPE